MEAKAFARLSVPRVDRAMIAGLAASVEQQVAGGVVAAPEAIIEVDRSSRLVEGDV